MGAGIALLALLEAVREHWAAMFAWLGLALVIDGTVFALIRGLVDHGSRLAFTRATGAWPGEEQPDNK